MTARAAALAILVSTAPAAARSVSDAPRDPPASVVLAPRSEPGERMILALTVEDAGGKPVRGAVVYAYHTSAKGWYGAEGAHVRANSGDVNHARLFGYGRTDAQGKLLVRTIRPAGYPHSELPAHVHLGLRVGGESVAVGEVRFQDDPRMTPEVRKQSLEEGDTIVRPQVQPDGAQRCLAEFQVRVAA
jgi:protocatechuate 3,4-dioxygenase beta subunit